jgi:Flp pilus assembly pilin Flp
VKNQQGRGRWTLAPSSDPVVLCFGVSSISSAGSGGKKMTRLVAILWKDQNGEDLTEYALLLVFLSFAAVSAMNSLAGGIKAAFSNAASVLNAAT